MRTSISEPRRDTRAASSDRLRQFVQSEALKLGFDGIAFTTPDAIPSAAPRLRQAIADGHHATMEWMAETAARRSSPANLWPQARSVVMLAMNYGPDSDPLGDLAHRDRGLVSVYARNRDYHDVIKGRLKELAGKLAARSGKDVKVFVDTAPVMEKPLAAAAGLGWQGKHTNLVSRSHGSWLFLGSIFAEAELEPDLPEVDHCGSCRSCLDICPTNAFPQPYRLDARRCISYLTIEHKGPIPHEFRPLIGNRIYGCDDCLAVCPWNKFAQASSEAKFVAREELRLPFLAELLRLDDPGFRAMFSGSPIKRIGRDRFLRNVLIAAGNSADACLAEACLPLVRDQSPIVRGAAVWALSRLLSRDHFHALRASEGIDEQDRGVLAEWAMLDHPQETLPV